MSALIDAANYKNLPCSPGACRFSSLSEKDSLGREYFILDWHDVDTGKTRGQVFFATLADYVAQKSAGGWVIESEMPESTESR